MLDAGINKTQPTMFVNIGLQNGVLLRTVLDPVNGQLTDTRTRSVPSPYFLRSQLICCLQFLGNPPYPPDSCDYTKESCHRRSVYQILVELHASKQNALYAVDLGQLGLCLEFLR